MSLLKHKRIQSECSSCNHIYAVIQQANGKDLIIKSNYGWPITGCKSITGNVGVSFETGLGIIKKNL